MKNAKSFSLVRRLTTTVLILLLILLSIQIAGTLWGRYVVTQELYTSTQNNVNYLRGTFEENVQRIRRDMTDQLFYRDSSQLVLFYTRLRKGSFSTGAHYQWELNRLRLELDVAQQMNALIDGMEVCFPRLEKELKVQQGDISIRSVRLQEIEDLYTAFQASDSALTRIGSAFYLPCYYPISATSARNGHILIALRLSEDRIQDMLSSFNTFSGNNAFLYHYPSGGCLTRSSLPIGAAELQSLLAKHGKQDTRAELTAGGRAYAAMCAYSEKLDCSFIQLIPSGQISRVPNLLLISALVFFITMLTVILLILRSFHRHVNCPVRALVHAYSRAGRGDLAVRVEPQTSREFTALATGFNQMTDRLEELIDTNYRQTITLQQAQLKTLQAQINPHFLYNSFFFLRSMLEDEDTETAAKFTGYLGKYFRYITKADGSLLTLESEYDHAVTYLKIQLMRFGETIQAEIPPVPEELKQHRVPKLFLQPVLENCIVHGMTGSSGIVRIRISFAADGGEVSVTVENSGDGFDPELPKTLTRRLENDTDGSRTTGLVNVHRRLKLCYGTHGGVELSVSDLGGLMVKLRIGEKDA